MAVTGTLGSSGVSTYFRNGPISLGVTLPANTYPNGTVTFNSMGQTTCWFHNGHVDGQVLTLYLCDSAGNNAVKLCDLTVPGNTNLWTMPTMTVSGATGLVNKALYIKATGTELALNRVYIRNQTTITINTATLTHSVTCAVSPSGTGTLTASPASAASGATVTLTPSPATGYHLSSYSSSPSVSISSNKFTMPASNVTITANFALTSYSVTCSAGTGGSLSANKSTATMGTTVTLTPTASTGYHFVSYSTSPSVTISNNAFTMPAANVTITANFAKTTYSITKAVSPSGSGTLASSVNSATMGTSVTLTPTPATGYQLSSYTTSPSTSVSNNKFTMPASNITVTANFTKIAYTITKAASPSAGGTVTVKKGSTAVTSANYGDTITISQTANTGYYFNGWTTSPSVTITSGSFTMPASAITVTAKYLKRSTASLNTTSMTGGGTATLTITTESNSYTHKYKLSFGTNMETSLTSVAAGTKTVTISIPDSWSNQIPSATSKSGGTLLLETYSGSTKIGEYTISNLTYNVRSSAVPTIGTITTSIVRTIGSKTYANVGSYYVQNHSGVRIQTTASGALGSTITSVRAYLNGYSGSNYDKTVSTSSIDFTTGLLTVSGTQTITVITTDSRGRTASKTTTITVTAYNNPKATLSAYRVDVNGDADDMGTYAKYSITNKTWSAIGNNSLTMTLTSQGSSETISSNTGNIRPSSRQTFSIQQEYTITLTMADSFETVTITGKVPSAKFIIYANAAGDKLGLMKAAGKTIPSGKNATIELSGDAAVYIGDDRLDLPTLQNAMAIIANGDSHIAISKNQYVYVKNNTHGLADGMYVASANVAENGNISSSNMTTESKGGLNAIKSKINNAFVRVVKTYTSVTIPSNGYVQIDTFGDIATETQAFTTAWYLVSMTIRGWTLANLPLGLLKGSTGTIFYVGGSPQTVDSITVEYYFANPDFINSVT